MSSLRAVLLIAVLAIGYAAAAGLSACPSAPTGKLLYTNTSLTCSAAQWCSNNLCTCWGGTAGSTHLACTLSSYPNCTTSAWCIGKFMKCMNDAASNSSANCSALKDLHMSLLQVSAGTRFNQSTAWTSCVNRGCMLLNSSTSDNCTLDATVKDSLCMSPVSFRGVMRLRSTGWTAVVAAAGDSIKAGLKQDMAKVLKLAPRAVTIESLRVVPVARRRRQSAGLEDLIVSFLLAGVNANNAELTAAIAIAAADPAWLQATLVAYKAAGGTGTFAVLGLAAATPGVTLGPGTPVPATNGTGTDPTTAPTTSGNTTTGTTTSGAAFTSTLVAAVLALLLVVV